MPFLQKITTFLLSKCWLENSGDFGLNLIVSNSAIKAMLFYECRLAVLMNHSETIVIKAT